MDQPTLYGAAEPSKYLRVCWDYRDILPRVLCQRDIDVPQFSAFQSNPSRKDGDVNSQGTCVVLRYQSSWSYTEQVKYFVPI